LDNRPWPKCLLGPNIHGVNTRTHSASRRIEKPAIRPEEKIRRYLAAREQLERRRREGSGERFAHLRRMHD
jgi:hypothetical protein